MTSPLDELGSFLRARRDALTPREVGLAAGGNRRRVRGLRREEVAILAGVSTDYYRRLEQGREYHPSVQVLVALSRALQLDSHATDYLVALVHPAPIAKADRSNPTVSAGLRLILDQGLQVPALIVDASLDVLAINRYAAALYKGFQRVDSLPRMVFLDPAANDFYEDWKQVATQVVANLRSALTAFPRDARIAEVVSEMSARSAVFAALWAEHHVRPRSSEDKRFNHPDLGPLQLHFEAMEIADAPDQRLFVYCPYDDASSAASLNHAGTLVSSLIS